MKNLFAGVLVACGVLLSPLHAQGPDTAPKHGIPAGALSARTIAVVDDTREKGVEKGAETALQSWGQFKLVDDPQLADITLRFEKTRSHDGQSTQKTDPNGKPTDYGYSMSFASSIHMNAYLKDGDAPFYSTRTDDSRAKAGMSCVNDFHTAYRTALQQSRQ